MLDVEQVEAELVETEEDGDRHLEQEHEHHLPQAEQIGGGRAALGDQGGDRQPVDVVLDFNLLAIAVLHLLDHRLGRVFVLFAVDALVLLALLEFVRELLGIHHHLLDDLFHV